MEGSIGKRYLPEKPILPLPNGMIYLGIDLSLKRNVILYVVDSSDESFAKNYIRLLGEASHFSDETFMHILDLGLDTISNRLIAVLKLSTGIPLMQEVCRQTLTFQESIRLIYELTLSMQKAFKEGITGFSVGADNLWLNEEKHLVVMNYWEQGTSNQQGIKGLCGLFYQLVTGSPSVPVSWQTMESLLQESLHGIPVQQRDALMRLMNRVALEYFPLTAFTDQLQQLLIQSGERDTEKAHSGLHLVQREAEYIETEPSKRAAIELEPDQQRPETVYSDTGRKSFRWIFKRVFVMGAAFLGVVVLVAFILIGLIDNHKPNRVTVLPLADDKAPVKQSPQPQETVKVKETKPDTVSHPVAGQGPVEAPSLIGLSREEAEKRALGTGLHYQYFLEASEQAQGTVLKQDPLPKTTVPSGGNITFWVSKGK